MYYTYFVKNIENGKVYFGSRTAKHLEFTESKDDFMVKYFTSSADIELKEAIKNHKVKYGIIHEYTDITECLMDEQELIRLFWMFFGRENSYNHSYLKFNGEKVFSTAGISLSEETRKKISVAQKGKRDSDETRKKKSIALKGRPSIWKGKHLPEETCRKISESHKGIRPSEETRRKMSEAKKDYKPSDETRKIWSEHRKRGLHPRAKKIKNTTTGQIWDCIGDCADFYNVTPPLIHYWLKKGKNNLIRL